MAAVTVWSERDDPNSPGGAWRDCMYSAGLMALVFGGKASFPHGFYSVTEREYLERADNQPDETGASLADLVTAVHNRYGIDWHTSAIGTMAQYAARADLGFVITGSNGNLPAGHTLRRWDPGFTGGHAVFIVPTGDGTHVKWYDPEATMKYAGDTTDWATVRRWMGAAPSYILVRRDAYAPPPPPVPDPLVYTEAQMRAVKADLATVQADLATTKADLAAVKANLELTAKSLETTSNNLSAALRRIDAAKTALG